MAQQEPVEDRIARKYNIAESGCWEWTDRPGTRGYGGLRVGGKKGKWVDAHRIAYLTFVGPVPEGLELDHLCRNRKCINFDHLEPVTRRENVRRGISCIAAHMRKTHCKNGHEFTEANTYTVGGTRRKCRICTNAAVARYTQRKRAAALQWAEP